ncbi:hypothetical protein [Ruminococcus sp. YE71]|nr:hypothetical protein [Ruminococcus sp. YE71]
MDIYVQNAVTEIDRAGDIHRERSVSLKAPYCRTRVLLPSTAENGGVFPR